MPSFPQSLLWISLVVLWLFVLVPMLINKRDTVRRTSDVALATRVLNGGAKSRLIKKKGPAAGHRHDPDWQPDAEVYPDLFEEAEEFAEQQDVIRVYDDAVREARMGGTRVRSVVVVAAMSERTVSESDYLDVDVVDMDSGALPVGGAAAFDEPAQRPQPQAEVSVDSEPLSEPETLVEPASEAAEPEPEFVAEPERSAVAPEPEKVAKSAERDRSDEYELIEDSSGLEEESRVAAPSLSASRQRRMENTAATAVSARKYRFRRRVLTVLAALLMLSAVLSVFVDPTLWWGCGAIGAVMVLYLGYLRRQTRIEAQVRRRRQQRQARTRPFVEDNAPRSDNVAPPRRPDDAAPPRWSDDAAPPRWSDDAAPPRRPEVDYDEFPTRLQRPGAVVLEIDDEDPVFEHLDEMAYSGSRYRPTHGPTDLPRASGQ